jgi:hypothetical protein
MTRDRGYTLDEVRAFHATLHFHKLSEQLSLQLADIEPSQDRDLRYHPCLVCMKDGTERDFVYLVEAQSWLRHWGPPPWRQDDYRRDLIEVDDIQSIRNSPNRLPPHMANKIYAAGETGMGYTIFTVQFRDGSTVAFGTGNAVDFIRYPSEKTAADVVDVIPHPHGRRIDPSTQRAPQYVWAPFEL